MSPAVCRDRCPARGFWGVVFAGQTYLNMAYLFLSFPLGIIYFVALTTGLSVGLGTLVIWIGLFVLLGTLLAVRGGLLLEKLLARGMLQTSVMSTAPQRPPATSTLDRAKRLVSDKRTWLGILYLLIKFPLGMISFTMVVLVISVASCLASPFLLTLEWNQMTIGDMAIDTQGKAGVTALVAVPVLIVCLHAMNGLAWVHAQLARLCLGR